MEDAVVAKPPTETQPVEEPQHIVVETVQPEVTTPPKVTTSPEVTTPPEVTTQLEVTPQNAKSVIFGDSELANLKSEIDKIYPGASSRISARTKNMVFF